MSTEFPDVRPGQTWVDNDPRCHGRRRLRVLDVASGKATCLILTDWEGNTDGQRRTTIAVRRFRPNSTGYRLEADSDR